MWYDKTRKEFHEQDRDVEDMAAKLRLMAMRIEQGSFGALSLHALGDVFGNEFWSLIYPATQMTRVVRETTYVD